MKRKRATTACHTKKTKCSSDDSDISSISSLLSEDQFLCSICLDIFTNPVSTPCGHSFCMTCIGVCWDRSDVCRCPLCKKNFPLRPDLSVNRSLAEITEQFKKTRVSALKEGTAKPGEVSCDICTGRRLKAVKSCLLCLASYCEIHMEPHLRVATLKKHKLVDPVQNLEDRLCKKHERLLELFCRTDQTCICLQCAETDHRTHDTICAESEWTEKKTQLKKIETEAQQMIQDRLKKVKEIKQATKLSKSCAQREIKDSVQVFTDLLCYIEDSQTEFIKLIDEKQRATERRAEGIIKELEQEIIELKKRNTEMDQLSHTEDHLLFLQSFQSLCSTQQTKDWSGITILSDLYLGDLKKAVCQLKDIVRIEVKRLSEIEFQRIRSQAVDVSLDPSTVNPWLILSADRKQVKHADKQQVLPDNPERFQSLCVLGKEGFTSGRHYWEVEVGEKGECFLGVARQSVNRKNFMKELTPKDGFWTVSPRHGKKLIACAAPPVILTLNLQPRKVGVYVDYEGGQVSFYNVEARSHIYTFTDTFTEKLYPYFCLSFNKDDINSPTLIISSVNCAD
nr:PREDICTED: E3 ubiquitin-protein ligase TRIM39-like [Lepisosteus oculatus]